MNGKNRPVSPTGGEKHIELSPIHDFARKLHQGDVLPRLKEYVLWQADLRRATAEGRPASVRPRGDACQPRRSPTTPRSPLIST